MKPRQIFSDATLLDDIDPDKPVLIAGPTASGKSDLAMRIAESQGGVIVNADASQVYSCWRVLTARPSRDEESRLRHLLYGHVACEQPYSVGHWLRDVATILAGHERAIVVGGTGLYFTALTEGLADIPATPEEVRSKGNTLSRDAMLRDLDTETLSRIDTLNRARVQRAWEVQQATGRGLAHWQDDTKPPLLPLSQTHAVVFDAPKDWLLDRIAQRFDRMIEGGALEEVRAVLPTYNPDLPAHRAIGVPELVSFLKGDSDLETARAAAVISTRQFAKRQRTWFRSRMSDWAHYQPASA